MTSSDVVKNIVVIKVGSSSLVDDDFKLKHNFISSLCEQVLYLKSQGFHPIIVSSGAAAAGMERLGFSERPTETASLQACCAAGQAALTEMYAEILAESGVACGQVLLTRGDIMERDSYLCARNTLECLLDLGAVPVVNENDTVSSTELTFGDNDMLGAIVSTLVGASLYMILSDIDGLYTANPNIDPSAELIERVEQITPEIVEMAGGAGTSVGTGGMATKIRAARAMLASGIPMVICNSSRENICVETALGTGIGTRFETAPDTNSAAARKFWIGLANVARGTLVIDSGAKGALLRGGGSLLPVGILKCEGDFAAGDLVTVKSEQGEVLAKGICRYSSDEMDKVRGLKLDIIARFYPEHETDPAIHRDEMLLF